MYTNHYGTIEYPHNGYFYYVGVDESKPLDQQIEEKIHLFDTNFDLAEGENLNANSFKLFFPFDYKKGTLTINEGNLFEGFVWGAKIKGRIIGIYPSQLGGCTVLCVRI